MIVSFARAASVVGFVCALTAGAAPLPRSFQTPAENAAPAVPLEKIPRAHLILIAHSLLNTPAHVQEEKLAESFGSELPELREAIQWVAVREELMDPREQRYLLAKDEDFAGDLNVLRRRFAELKDAPKIIEAQRLPPRDLVNERIKFNRAFHTYCETQLAWDRPNEDIWSATLQENKILYNIWDKMRDARCDFYYVTVRRQALLQFKQLIGDENYALGNYPPNVPIWRFREMK